MTVMVSLYGKITRVRPDPGNGTTYVTLSNQDGVFEVRAKECASFDATRVGQFVHIGGALRTYVTEAPVINVFIEPRYVDFRSPPDTATHVMTVIGLSLAGTERCFTCPAKCKG